MAGSSIVYMLLLIVVLQRDIGHNKLTAMGERCSCVCGVCVCGVCVVSIGIHTFLIIADYLQRYSLHTLQLH